MYTNMYLLGLRSSKSLLCTRPISKISNETNNYVACNIVHKTLFDTSILFGVLNLLLDFIYKTYWSCLPRILKSHEFNKSNTEREWERRFVRGLKIYAIEARSTSIDVIYRRNSLISISQLSAF